MNTLKHRRVARLSLIVAATIASSGLATAGAATTPDADSAAAVTRLDPGSLERGADPSLPYLVNDQIRDGDIRINVASQPNHLSLWETAGGYLLLDQLFSTGQMRLTAYDRDGESRVIASGEILDVVVSEDKRRIAVVDDLNGGLGPFAVKVVNPTTGNEFGARHFGYADAIALDGERVFLNRRDGGDIVSGTWKYETNVVKTLAQRQLLDADLRQRILVFAGIGSGGGEGCARVTWMGESQALWRACQFEPVDWSRDGRHALATWDYFDMAGTDRWLTVDGRNGERTGRVSGRLDWIAVWESNNRFLTIAQGDDGQTAIVRCTVGGACERASRTWDRPVVPDLYYNAPPVLIAEN